MWLLVVEVFIPHGAVSDGRPSPHMINPPLFFFTFIFFLHCHWNSSFSFKRYCISHVSINLTLSLCLPFRFSSPCIPASILFRPSPFPQAQPPLWYSQSHLQSDIFSGLITLSSHNLIEHLTSTPTSSDPNAPFSPPPTYRRWILSSHHLLSALSSCPHSLLFPPSPLNLCLHPNPVFSKTAWAVIPRLLWEPG